MSNEKSDVRLSSLSKEELIHKVSIYKSLYETEKLISSEHQETIKELNNEILDLEAEKKQKETELSIYRNLEKYRNKDNEEKDLNRFLITLFSYCCSAFCFYHYLSHYINKSVNIELKHLLFSLIPLFFSFYIYNAIILFLGYILYQITEKWKKNVIDIVVAILAFLIVLCFLVFN